MCSFAHIIIPGKRFHLRTQFPQVNVTFAHIKFSQVNGMPVVAGLYRRAKWNILKQIVENEEFYMKVLDSEKKEKVRRKVRLGNEEHQERYFHIGRLQ